MASYNIFIYDAATGARKNLVSATSQVDFASIRLGASLLVISEASGHFDFGGKKLTNILAGTAEGHAVEFTQFNNALDLKLDASEVGVSVASLVGGKIPATQLPNAIMEYQGVWDASTNTPALSDFANGAAAAEMIGSIYRVTVAGSQNLGSGTIEFSVGDYAILNSDGKWERSDTSDAVTSVNGMTGAVEVVEYDAAQARTDLISSSITQGVTDKAPTSGAVYDALANKSDVGHTHVAADITDFDSAANSALATALAGKSDVGHGHAATEISVSAISGMTSDDVQEALGELKGLVDGVQTNLDNHVDDAAGAHAASAISITAISGLEGATVQEALANLHAADVTEAGLREQADNDLSGRVDNLEAFQSDIEGVNDWIATTALFENSKIKAIHLPSYVDDVVEAANFASLPVAGEADKIYVAIDTGKVYRWGGSAYVEIAASPGSTDAVPEGTTNLYFTDERAQDAVGGMLVDTATIDLTYNDEDGELTADVKDGSINAAKLDTGLSAGQVDAAIIPIDEIAGMEAGDVQEALVELKGMADLAEEALATKVEKADSYRAYSLSESVGALKVVALGVSSVAKADATDDALEGKRLGITKVGGSASASVDVFVKYGEIIPGFTGLTVGSPYFVSDATPGEITLTRPADIGEVVYRVGFAVSATELSFEPMHEITL